MPGAQQSIDTPPKSPPESPFSAALSIQFRYEKSVASVLADLCPPSKAWLEQFVEVPAPPGEEAVTASMTAIMTLEACGSLFLRRKLAYIPKASEVEFLNELLRHSHALYDLLLSYNQLQRTSVDPFFALELISQEKGDDRSREDFRDETLRHLLTLSTFARVRLQQGIRDSRAINSAEEKARRRTNYRQHTLVADLLAAYTRISGKRISASVRGTGPDQKVSPAIAFLMVAMPPILAAARLVNTSVEAEALKKEVATVKREWAEGFRPELEYYAHR